MNDNNSKSSRSWGITAIAMLPVAYVLSIGPAGAFVTTHRVPLMHSYLQKFYEPVVWLHDNTPMKGPLEFCAPYWRW